MTEHTPEARAAYPPKITHSFSGGEFDHNAGLRTAFDRGRSSMVETVTTEQWVIEAELYRTDDGHDPLPPLIGPFDSRGAAEAWFESQLPLWGEHSICRLFRPDREEETA